MKNTWFIVVLIGTAVFAYIYFGTDEKEKTTEFSEVETGELVDDLMPLIERNNANYKWMEELENKWKIMQAHLEEKWLTDQPILIFGNITDYRRDGSEYYRVAVEPYSLNTPSMISWNFEFDLRVKKEVIDALELEHPDAFLIPSIFNPDIAWVAKIERVETRLNGQFENIRMKKYGVGQLIELKYIGADKTLLDDAYKDLLPVQLELLPAE